MQRPSLFMSIRYAWVLALLLLAACGARPRPQVADHSLDHPDTVVTRVPEYSVGRGDTLYGIAFRLGVDYRELARWNRIHPPYTIYPGQKLQVADSSPAPVPAAVTASPSATGRHGTTSVATRRAASTGAATAPIRPAQRTPPEATAPQRTTPAAQAARPATTAATTGGAVSWRWPVSGTLLSSFAGGDQLRQGIDIGGAAGTPVSAAAAGEVVYSGSGLVGYGELIIVKHNDVWLSAYGHNRKRLVNEGEKVSAGQTIAELGRSGSSRDMLHFEIRRNGKPVDPLPLLPRR